MSCMRRNVTVPAARGEGLSGVVGKNQFTLYVELHSYWARHDEPQKRIFNGEERGVHAVAEHGALFIVSSQDLQK